MSFNLCALSSTGSCHLSYPVIQCCWCYVQWTGLIVRRLLYADDTDDDVRQMP